MAITQHDVRLGEIYYRYLLELARNQVGDTIQYGALVNRAKADFPDDEIVKGAIPRSIGKRLFTIEDFCIKYKLPNLACLAVSRHGVPGDSYTNNWEEEKARVAGFDWTSVEAVWNLHVDSWRKTAQKPVKRTRAEAEKEFTAHWQEDSKGMAPLYPNRLDDGPKEAIIGLIEKGHDPADAFAATLFPDEDA